MTNISINKGLGKISIKNFADSISYDGPNLIKNPKFDQDNYYPYDGYDQNYLFLPEWSNLKLCRLYFLSKRPHAPFLLTIPLLYKRNGLGL